jgi:SAM-dependent methyltransferase
VKVRYAIEQEELGPMASSGAAHLGGFDISAPHPDDYVERNRAFWDRLAPMHITAGRKAWGADELRWGLWGTPESDLQLLVGLEAGEDAIELGCGTAAISAWLARRGMRPVAVDVSQAQLRNAENLQLDFDLRFPLICANAEEIAFDDESFDLAVSEYGASLWCDPRRWLAEAGRLLRGEGRLIFVTNSALLLACTPADGGPVGERLVRDYFAPERVEFEHDGPVEFHLTHGQWIRLLREHGFVVDDLIEVQPGPKAKPQFDFVTLEWARRWPSEEIWIARRVD